MVNSIIMGTLESVALFILFEGFHLKSFQSEECVLLRKNIFGVKEILTFTLGLSSSGIKLKKITYKSFSIKNGQNDRKLIEEVLDQGRTAYLNASRLSKEVFSLQEKSRILSKKPISPFEEDIFG